MLAAEENWTFDWFKINTPATILHVDFRAFAFSELVNIEFLYPIDSRRPQPAFLVNINTRTPNSKLQSTQTSQKQEFACPLNPQSPLPCVDCFYFVLNIKPKRCSGREVIAWSAI